MSHDHTKNEATEAEEIIIVYDIPTDGLVRIHFYRGLKRLEKRLGVTYTRWTESVLVTYNRRDAKEICDLLHGVGARYYAFSIEKQLKL